MTTSYIDFLSRTFAEIFKTNHQNTTFAPGRANIIGEHTDYNDGFVLPFAIQQGIWFVASPSQHSTINIYAYNEKNMASFSLLGHTISDAGWTKYASQVIQRLNIDHTIRGIDIVFGGNMPIGGGVSSSSALTCGLIDIITKTLGIDMDANTLVNLAVQSEHGTGVIGGIMDQYTITNGKEGQAILLDCRDRSTQFIPLPQANFYFYLVNTNVKHNLVETDYNLRRKECGEATSIINKHRPEIHSMRDLSLDDIDEIEGYLTDILYRRTRHVVSENARVLATIHSLQEHDFEYIGTLLHGSHDSLRDDYEVSCDELDWQVDYAKQFDFILGSRMMGGGFGGCTIHLTTIPWSDDFMHLWSKEYKKEFGIDNHIIPILSGNGIRL
jgi:galactokinase